MSNLMRFAISLFLMPPLVVVGLALSVFGFAALSVAVRLLAEVV